MLTFTKQKRSKTSIMQNANLNHYQLVRYLDFLLEIDLLNFENHKKLTYYTTTSKGLEFLNRLNDMHNLITPEVDAIGNKLIHVKEFSNFDQNFSI